jgi:hypothetical protein
MGHSVQAESGLDAIRQIAKEQPSHLQGIYFAVPDSEHVWSRTTLRTEHLHHLELDPIDKPKTRESAA